MINSVKASRFQTLEDHTVFVALGYNYTNEKRDFRNERFRTLTAIKIRTTQVDELKYINTVTGPKP